MKNQSETQEPVFNPWSILIEEPSYLVQRRLYFERGKKGVKGRYAHTHRVILPAVGGVKRRQGPSGGEKGSMRAVKINSNQSKLNFPHQKERGKKAAFHLQLLVAIEAGQRGVPGLIYKLRRSFDAASFFKTGRFGVVQ